MDEDRVLKLVLWMMICFSLTQDGARARARDRDLGATVDNRICHEKRERDRMTGLSRNQLRSSDKLKLFNSVCL